MDKIKQFFREKKAKAKFAMMGEGSKLNASSNSTVNVPRAPSEEWSIGHGRVEPTNDAKVAGEAALARMTAKNNMRVPSASAAYLRLKSQIEAEVKRENAVQKVTELPISEQKEVLRDGPRILEVNGIYFTCPLLGPETASWNEIKEKIADFLEKQLFSQEPCMASALMIHSLNKDQDKVQKCIEMLSKYLENVMANPTEQKFCRIRFQNKALQDKVMPVRGGVEFLKAVGFEEVPLEGENGMEPFLVLPESRRAPAELREKLDILTLAEPVVPILDRGVRVFFPSVNAGRFGDLPDEFYAITKEELRREQQVKQEEVEKLGMLRTKAMRERDAQRELRRYRCSLIRFRFPDQTLLQGTFLSTETAKELITFVKEHVEPEWAPFALSFRSVQGLPMVLNEETTGTIAEHGLCPAALMTVVFNSDLMEQCKAEQIPPPRIKPATLELIQSL